MENMYFHYIKSLFVLEGTYKTPMAFYLKKYMERKLETSAKILKIITTPTQPSCLFFLPSSMNEYMFMYSCHVGIALA